MEDCVIEQGMATHNKARQGKARWGGKGLYKV